MKALALKDEQFVTDAKGKPLGVLRVRFFLSVSFLPIRASIGPNHGWLVWFGVGA